MKRIVTVVVLIMVCVFSSCGKTSNDKEREKVIDNVSMMDEEENSSQSVTTEWTNQYLENYRKISKQSIRLKQMDFGYYGLRFALPALDNNKEAGYESCIALVTLVEVQEKDSDTSNVILKIEDVLQHNGLEQEFAVGKQVCGDSGVKWLKCDDDTYEIVFNAYNMPIAEVGYRYIVNLTLMDGQIDIECMTLPLDINYCIIDTVATGDNGYLYETNEILWYYDLNNTYYLEYWRENSEHAETLREVYGKDVYNKAHVIQ